MKKEKLTRREFFRTCGRTAVAGGLAALGLLLSRRKSSAGGSQKCINSGICRGCGVFASCSLPQALSAKLAKSKEK